MTTILRRSLLTFVVLAAGLLVLAAEASAQNPAYYNGGSWWAKAAIYRQLDNTNPMWGQISNQSSSSKRYLLCLPYDPVADVVGAPSWQLDAVLGQTSTYHTHNIWDDTEVGLGSSNYSIVCFGSNIPFQNMIFSDLPILKVIRLTGVNSGYDLFTGKVRVDLGVQHLDLGKSTATLKVVGPGGVNQVLGTIAPQSLGNFNFLAPKEGLTYTLYAKTTGGWKSIQQFVVSIGGGGGSCGGPGQVPCP